MEKNYESFEHLSCGEVSSLWMGYQYESLHRCGITFFLQHVKDDAIQQILKDGLVLANKRIEQISELFLKYNQLLPKDRKSTRLNSSHVAISYAVFSLK